MYQDNVNVLFAMWTWSVRIFPPVLHHVCKEGMVASWIWLVFVYFFRWTFCGYQCEPALTVAYLSKTSAWLHFASCISKNVYSFHHLQLGTTIAALNSGKCQGLQMLWELVRNQLCCTMPLNLKVFHLLIWDNESTSMRNRITLLVLVPLVPLEIKQTKGSYEKRLHSIVLC